MFQYLGKKSLYNFSTEHLGFYQDLSLLQIQGNSQVPTRFPNSAVQQPEWSRRRGACQQRERHSKFLSYLTGPPYVHPWWRGRCQSCNQLPAAHVARVCKVGQIWSVSPSVDMLPLSVTIPATVPQRSEIPEGLMNYPVLCLYRINTRKFSLCKRIWSPKYYCFIFVPPSMPQRKRSTENTLLLKFATIKVTGNTF